MSSNARFAGRLRRLLCLPLAKPKSLRASMNNAHLHTLVLILLLPLGCSRSEQQLPETSAHEQQGAGKEPASPRVPEGVSDGVAPQAAGASGTQPHFGPKVLDLLRASGNEQGRLAFCTALSAIARDDRWEWQDYDSPETAGVVEGQAAQVDYRKESYVVVVLHWPGLVIPGPNTYELMLLDRVGHRLDRVACEVSTRVTQEGIFLAEMRKSPEKDGSQFVIRYVPTEGDKMPSHFGHIIHYRGHAYHFAWDPDVSAQAKPVTWSQTGLCRITVEDGKFKVIFPILGPSPGKQAP